MDGRARKAGHGGTVERARPDSAALTATELRFLQDVSHELRAPLTVAIGYLELVVDQVGEGVVPPVVLDELTRMGRIIDDLQALALAGRPDFLDLETLETIVLADELLLKASALAPSRSWSLGRVDSVTFVADRDRLTEAVLNLADNAIGATTDGDAIVLNIRRCGRALQLSVCDHGIGIAEEDVARVLRRFERGAQTRHRYRGAGLGLTVVQSIAAAHGGHFELRSHERSGTTSTIEIALVEPEAETS